MLTAVVSIFASQKSFSQDLYDINTIQTIEIVFTQSNWDELLDLEMAGDNNYTQAESVTINGELFETVGVKYKGNSSYNPNYNKNPFHIELDTYVDQDYQGYKDLKLANVIFDPSFVRETVSYNIAGQYMDAPKANYANIYVNGVLIGLYTNTEAITKRFVDDTFGSKTNAFFSCSPPDGAGPGSNAYPSLEYLGPNSSSYEIKSDGADDWDELIELTNILNNDVTNIETVLDVDRALWMLAFDNVMVNLDSYIGQFKQNYYLYKTDAGVFNSVVWDLNMSFGVFSMTGEGPPLNSTTQKAQISHLLHINNTSFPLISKLLAIPRYKKMYLAHFKTILTENITNSNYLTLANDYQDIIDAAVQADNNKFYTYAQFVGNINTDYNLGQNTAPGLTNLMNARGSYLSALSDFTVTQPTISNVAPSNNDPDVGDAVSFTATVTNSNAVFLGYRTNQYAPFTKIQMYDDGAHNDGAAGDNVFGIDLTITNDYTHYYVYAENTNIGAFSPARAQHEFYTLNANYIPLPVGALVINELMADNETIVTDQDGEYDDWIELYNNTNETLSLDGLYLSDDPTDLLQWEFPDGLTIAPDSYLIVWCDKDLDQDGLHADIKFSAGGESAILSYADGTIIENIEFGQQETDLSYSRIPNGTGDFIIKQATFGIDNEIILGTDSFDAESALNYYPNPTKSVLNITNSDGGITSVKVISILGQVLFSQAYNNSSLVEVDFSDFAKGTYFVSVNENTVIKILKD
ncbi:T9SS type A sorting domain-containing protein [Aequorivita antarctica]|uniref:T9SS type A sorting domain-containing protein n=2 Tax=Aequorivita antarctica TaxID=153266 RepID=A0A5C6YZ69_9FLAO|nr:T9SS type A sorting domain-containing protein [Aequorivita antarctica]